MSDGTNVKLTFEGLAPRHDYFSDMNYYEGYQGFDFTDMILMTRKGAHILGPPDDGYKNVLHGDAEIFIHGGGGNFNAVYGWIASPVSTETFNLKGGIFAAGDNTSLNAAFYAYDSSGHRIGQLSLLFGNTPTTIDFSNYGKSFKDASTIEFVGYSLGGGDATLAMDNLRVHWNGPIPDRGGTSSVPDLPVHRHHPHIAHALSLGAAQTHDGHAASYVVGTNPHHGELMSLAAALGHADPGGGLTAQFVLPHCDHFGT